MPRPILFSGPMVRAILDGRKTQTRRVLKINGARPDFCGGRNDGDDPTCWGWEDPEHGDWVTLEKEPGQRMGWRDWRGAYAPGDRLWVRESALYWIHRDTNKADKVAAYRADGYELEPGERWRPSIHMPRWASRLTLTVTDVRVQRVQEVSAADVQAEGVEFGVRGGAGDYRHQFQTLWDRLNAKRGFGWDANPWVVAITFDVHRANIDQMEQAA